MHDPRCCVPDSLPELARHDVIRCKVEKDYLSPNLSNSENTLMVSPAGRTGQQSCGVRPCVFVFLKKPRARENSVLGAQRLLPLAQALLVRALHKVAAQNSLSKAVGYLTSNWPKFGRLIADSNAAERTLRPFVIGRKDRVFSDRLKGATGSSTLQTDLDGQTQGPRALCVAAPRIGAPTAGDLG